MLPGRRGVPPSLERGGPVTVVMATRDRRAGAVATLRRLRALDERPPLVLVDDGSSDGTAAAVRALFPDVRVLRPDGPGGVAAARNAGVRAARTPYVAFADDDSWWAPGALAAAARHLDEHPRLGLVAARILVGEGQRVDSTCDAMAASPLPSGGLPGPRVLGFVACGTVVRRQAFLEAGGFPEAYPIGGEEEPLALALAAAGWDLAYVDDVVAHHHPDGAPRDHRRRHRNMTRNALRTTWRYRTGWGSVARTVEIVRGTTSPARAAGVAQALAELPWVLARRRPLPAEVERQCRLLARATGPGGRAVRRSGGRRQAAGVVAHDRRRAGLGADARVAVVVITRDRVDELLHSLARLASLPERPQVVVVDNGSTDGTAEAVRREHRWAELVVLDRNAGAAARNLGAAMVSQPYVAFADDDTWWEPGSLRRAADVLDAHPGVAAVTARIVVEPAGVEDPVVADMRTSPLSDREPLPGHPLLSFLAGASVVRRRAFLEAGGFSPLLGFGGEEELLAADLAAAGWRLRYLPELVVHHHASTARDPHRRRADGVRNTLWVTWLRRPLARAAWRSAALLRRAPHDRITALAVAEALRGLPWVLAERRRLPDHVERELRLLDRQQLDSGVRSYVS